MENFIMDGNGVIDAKRKGDESNYEFRLNETNRNAEMWRSKFICDDGATSISSHSNSKLRIDAMFDERSVLSEIDGNLDKPRTPISVRSQFRKERSVTNNIEERIEKLFQEITKNKWPNNGGDDDVLRTNLEGSSTCKNHEFTVTYIGSKRLRDKNLSLLRLQDPLKEIYFKHKQDHCNRQINILTISREGLKIRRQEKEELNPFSAIAVWTTVKLTFRQTFKTLEYAFVPLVTDPEGTDKNLLFKELKHDDECTLTHHKEVEESYGHPPIFTIVMKNVNNKKQLECHCFICNSSEEAVTLAENLYQALIKKLMRKKEGKRPKKEENATNKSAACETARPENCVGSKATGCKSDLFSSSPGRFVRPPDEPNQIELDSPPSEPSHCGNADRVDESARTAAGEEKPDERSGKREDGGLLEAGADAGGRCLGRASAGEGVAAAEDRGRSDGDILTKVTIPRSRSFLNANGPLCRFSRSHKSDRNSEITSPLGFKELFNEFQLDEGLENVDDILNVIIDAEGMSFNDLRPIYKEFLLKLAVTLTKDELYHRSQMIMRRQKKKRRGCSNFKRNLFLSDLGLKKFFKKTTKRLGSKNNWRIMNLKLTGSIVFPSSPNDHFSSESPGSAKNKTRIALNQRSRQKLVEKLLRTHKGKYKRMTSKRNRVFQLKTNSTENGRGGLNKSSSGYFSCSECSGNSECCRTCANAGKCYCTLCLKNKDVGDFDTTLFHVRKSNARSAATENEKVHPEDSFRSCSCDTESCTYSGICYCARVKSDRFKRGTLDSTESVNAVRNSQRSNERCLDRTSVSDFNCREFGWGGKEEGFERSEPNLGLAQLTPASPCKTDGNNDPRRGNVNFLRFPKKAHRLFEKESTVSKYFSHSDDGRRFKEIQNAGQISPCPSREKCQMVWRSEDGIEKPSENNKVAHAPFSSFARRRHGSMRSRQEHVSDSEEHADSGSGRGRVPHPASPVATSLRCKQNCEGNASHTRLSRAGAVNNGCLRFTKRMDVYDSLSEKNFFNLQQIYNNNQVTLKRAKNEFQTFEQQNFREPKNDNRVAITASSATKKKALMVSASEPKGKLVYISTNRKGVNIFEKASEKGGHSSEMSSAKHKFIHSDFLKEQDGDNYRLMSKNTNLENTLGYYP